MLKGESYLICKRVLDVAIVLVTMPLWILIIVLLALVIKIQSPRDPVFFIQQRTGKGGRRFAMYKFRTMVANAEELKEKYADLNELQWPDFKISNDPRVTKIGHFLRKTSLDELPQLFNILKGDMSLVGPRPTFFSPKKYDLWHTERLDARPGLTGLWQILGRGSVKFDERARLDIIYVEKRCLRLDLQILLHTIVVVLAQRGAH
ncbi:MAG: sugar transferase [Chloroflexi bacterium]|jgi:lipopolysaccharide/colanic/teichoic acid biosynthesis glycosyltransferase|nr:sugar transferase [Chloroflexota bacterium]